MKQKKEVYISIIIVSLFFSMNLGASCAGVWVPATYTGGGRILGKFVLKTMPGKHFDYALNIINYFREIGIDVTIQVENNYFIQSPLKPLRNFDIAIAEIGQKFFTPYSDLSKLISDNGLLNLCDVTTEMPYGNLSNELAKDELYSIRNYEEMINVVNDWMVLIADKIVPFLPLFVSKEYIAIRSGIIGFNQSWGLSNSLPYMRRPPTCYHHHFQRTDMNIVNEDWENLNPLERNYYESYPFSDFWMVKPITIENLLSTYRQSMSPNNQIISLVSEPILLWDPSNNASRNGIIYDWEQLSENKFKFFIRNNITWNPSYDITDRNLSSVPLQNIDQSELMIGLKNGEFSNGTNQELTAKDIAFTLLVYANPIISEISDRFSWIKNIETDLSKPSEFNISINEELTNTWNFWPKMNIPVLPEFF
ncbi:MAG: hypothetical protein ACXAAM_08280, partial [Candidatus Heimdallarchaeaceae archaeon]